MDEPMLLRPTETAQALGISRTKVYDLIARGELPSLRIGGSIRVPVDALRQWIDSCSLSTAQDLKP